MVKRLIVDLDGTLTINDPKISYLNKEPNESMIEKLRHYQQQGYEIIINTSRNVKTYKGNIGKINIHTLPIIIQWLDHHNVPYDEIYVGKPWCGEDGFYIDDRAVRPSEFIELSSAEINDLLEKEKK